LEQTVVTSLVLTLSVQTFLVQKVVMLSLVLTFLEQLALNKMVGKLLVKKPVGWIFDSGMGATPLVMTPAGWIVAILLSAVYVNYTVAMSGCGMNIPVVLYLLLKLKVAFESVMWFCLLETEFLKSADILLMFLIVNF